MCRVRAQIMWVERDYMDKSKGLSIYRCRKRRIKREVLQSGVAISKNHSPLQLRPPIAVDW